MAKKQRGLRETGPERSARLVDAMKKWQAIERKAVEHCAELMEKTPNPLIRQILEIIRNDSVQHHRVQQFIIDTLTTTPVNLTPEDLGSVWSELTAHDELEREVIELGKQLRDDCRFPVQRSLLEYLIYDEQKHDMLLGELAKFKSSLYPYA